MPTSSLYLITNNPTSLPAIPNISSNPEDKSIIITFSPNADGGSAITSYQYSTDDFITDINTIGANTSPYTINNLENGKLYNIEIRAVNKNGFGGKTISPDIIPGDVPPAPSITSIATGVTSQTATITYTNNGNNGSVIEYYIITYSSDEFVTSTTIRDITTNPYPLSGLTNGVSYKIRLQAKNANGDGAYVESVAFIPSTIPQKPTITSVVKGNASLTINFTANTDTGGNAITDYEYSTDTTGSTFTSMGQTTTAPYTITTGLENGIAIPIRIRARNANGVSDKTDSVSATPSTTPSAPTITSVTAGNASATINFTTGNTGGNGFTDYEYSKDDGLNFISMGQTTTTPYTITTGLTNGTEYKIKIRAVNGNGTGAISNMISVTPVSSPTDYAIYYPLTLINGDKVYNAVSGSYDGVFSGNPKSTISTTTYAFPTGSLGFVSTNSQYLTLPSYTNTLNTSLSISIWFKITAYPGTGIYPYIIAFANPSNYIGMYLNASNASSPGKIAIFINGSPFDTILPSLNTWTHFVWNINASVWTLYINGSLYNTYTGQNAPVIDKTRVVTLGGFGTHFINGFLQDFRVYNRILTSTEVTNLYNLKNIL